MLKLGYHPATYVRHGVDVAEALADIAASGWQGFEWSPGALRKHFPEPAALRSRIQELSLPVCGLYCPCGFRTEKEIASWHASIDEAIAFARAIGTDIIMIDGGSLELPVEPASVEKVARAANEAGRRVNEAGLGRPTPSWFAALRTPRSSPSAGSTSRPRSRST